MTQRHGTALLDIVTGLAAASVPVVVVLTTLAQSAPAMPAAEGIAGLAGAGTVAVLFGWYLYYQSAVAEPRREADRAKQIEVLTTTHATMLAQQQRDFAAIMSSQQERYEAIRVDQQKEADRLLEALIDKTRCPVGYEECPLVKRSGVQKPAEHAP